MRTPSPAALHAVRVLGVLGMLVLGCATPTELTVTVDSEVGCAAKASVAVVGGTSLAALASKTPQATSTGCSASGAEATMGNVVLVPAGDKKENIAFAVMTRPDGTSPDRCLDPAEAPGCIVALRELRFIPETELAVRVDLRLACLGVTCPSGQTCVGGACVSDVVDPTSCLLQCGEGDLEPDAGAPRDAQALDAADATLDTARAPMDATPDSPPADAAVDVAAPLFAIGGTVTGLGSGDVVVLEDNGGDELTVSTNGTFSFATSLASGASYAVTILTQPADPPGSVLQTCSVSQGTGTVASTAISNVEVTCVTDTFAVGGTVSGLAAGGTVVLADNGGDDVTVTSNGAFAFGAPVASGGSYAVTVATQPQGQTCTVTQTSTAVTTANVTVTVTCIDAALPLTLGGTVSGLALGDTIELQDNGGDDLFVTNNGTFAFSMGLPPGSPYAVTVSSPTSPVPQMCTVTMGSGTVGSSNVTTVDVTCTTLTAPVFTVGGTVTGLASSESLILENEGGDNLVVSANGSFTFAMPVVAGSSYDVTVQASPASPVAETCTVTGPSGVVGNANVTSPTVTCAPTQLTIGGTLSGLSSNDVVALKENGVQSLVLGANGPFTFAGTVASGTAYTVTVAGNPTNPPETCTVSQGTGTVGSADVSVVVSCVATPLYPVNVTVSGLAGPGGSAAETVVIEDNGGGPLGVSSNGKSSFATMLPTGAAYDVTVTSNPTSPQQTCVVTGGAGTIQGAPANVAVTCTPAYYSISGTVTGLLDGGSVIVADNDGGRIVLTTDGPFVVLPDVPTGTPYEVTIVYENNASCVLAQNGGDVTDASVSNILVTCVP